MANTKDYDPKKVTITVGTHIVEGFADGTFVTVSRNNQTWNTVSGASGEHGRSKSNDRSGTIELTIMQTSASNDVLSSFMALDETSSNGGKFPFKLIDAHGKTAVATVEAWIQQPPSVEYGKELGDRSWTLEAGDIEFFVGGTDVPLI